jgi:hypothetical protein
VLQPAFVPLIGETVAWLAASDHASSEIVAGATSLAGTARPGVVALPASMGQASSRVVVNADPREFDPSRQSVAEFLAHVPRAERVDRPSVQSSAEHDEATRGLWRYALALVLASLVVESIVGRRA